MAREIAKRLWLAFSFSLRCLFFPFCLFAQSLLFREETKPRVESTRRARKRDAREIEAHFPIPLSSLSTRFPFSPRIAACCLWLSLSRSLSLPPFFLEKGSALKKTAKDLLLALFF